MIGTLIGLAALTITMALVAVVIQLGRIADALEKR